MMAGGQGRRKAPSQKAGAVLSTEDAPSAVHGQGGRGKRKAHAAEQEQAHGKEQGAVSPFGKFALAAGAEAPTAVAIAPAAGRTTRSRAKAAGAELSAPVEEEEQGGPVAKKARRAPPAAAKPVKAKGSGGSSKATRAREMTLRAKGYGGVGGVDEAGRGPLAGPVVAAACILPLDGADLPFLDDSKRLTEEQREEAYEALIAHPGVRCVVDHKEIDRVDILRATFSAMRSSAARLMGPTAAAAAAAPPAAADAAAAGTAKAEGQSQEGEGEEGQKGQLHVWDDRGEVVACSSGANGPALDYLLVDGNMVPPGLGVPAEAIVNGDALCACIAAASILAKVTRDRIMVGYDAQYPQYGFAGHKGYGTFKHRSAIHTHGPCDIHRRSFEPVKSITGWSRETHEDAGAGGMVEGAADDKPKGKGGKGGKGKAAARKRK